MDIFQQSYMHRLLAEPARPRAVEHYEVFMPGPKKDVECNTLDLKSLPCCITGCHSWVWALNDSRRAKVLGRFPLNLQATAITGRAAMVPNELAHTDIRFQPHVLPADAPPPPVPADAMPAEEEPLTGQTRFFNGWRLSYRADEPEAWPASKLDMRLQRKINVFTAAGRLAYAGRRRKTSDELRQQSDRAAARVRVV
jgi:hypothetical protein